MSENKALDPAVEEALRSVWESLTEEQKEKTRACNTSEELTELAAKEGVELPDEVLSAVSGGYLYLYNHLWYVIDDNTGYAVGYGSESGTHAAAKAQRLGFSTEEISKEDMWKLRDEYNEAHPPEGRRGC